MLNTDTRIHKHILSRIKVMSLAFLILVLLTPNHGMSTSNIINNTQAPSGTILVPDNFLRRWDPVTLFFSKKRGQPGLSEDNPSQYVKLNPHHPGAYTWLNEKTLQFRPSEPWPPLSQFTWQIEGKIHTLNTLVSAPVSSIPAQGEVDLSAVESISLNFLNPVNPIALHKMLRIELRPLPGIDKSQSQWLSQNDFKIKVIERINRSDSAQYVINLDRPIDKGTFVQVHLRLSLDDAVDESFFTIEFSTEKPFQVQRVGCPNQFLPITTSGSQYPKDHAIRCNSSNRQIQIVFSSPLSDVNPIAARNFIHITPPIDNVKYQAFNKILTVNGDFHTEQLYRIELQEAPIRNSAGAELQLDQNSELYLFFPEQSSFLQWELGHGVLERFGPKMLPLKGRGFQRMDLRIHPINPLDDSFWPFTDDPLVVNEEARPEAPGEAPSAHHYTDGPPSRRELKRQIKALGAPSISEIIDIPLKKSGPAAHFGVNLSPYLSRISGTNKPGTYLVGMRLLNASNERTWVRVQVSDISLTTITEAEQLHFVVTSLKSGLPIKGASIRIVGKNSDILKVTTNTSGQYTWSIPFQGKDLVKKIIIQKGDDTLLLDPLKPPQKYANNLWLTDHQRWLQWTQHLNQSHDQSGVTTCHLFTERPIYKPADKVHIKGYIRNIRQGKFSIPKFNNTEIFINGPGKLEWIFPVDVSKMGSFYTAFNEENLPTGKYTASFRYNGKVCTSMNFSKEAYRLPKFEVQLTGPRITPIDAPFKIALNAQYYAGGQVAEQTIRWQVTQFPYTWTPSKQRGFFYSTDAQYSKIKAFRSTATIDQTGLTDALGNAQITLDPRIEVSAQARRYIVEATVTGADDQSVTSTFESLALPPFVLGLKVPRYTENKNAINAQIIVADNQGKSIAGQQVTIRMKQRQWHSHLQLGDFSQGVANYVTEVVDELVYEKNLISTDAISSLKLPIAQAGVYIVEIESLDKLGRSQNVSVDLFAGGDEPVSWSRQASPVFEIATDKSSYDPGDTATLLLQSPFQTARALAIVENPNGRSSYEWLNVRGGTAEFKILIDATNMPRQAVHFLLYRGRIGSHENNTIDLGKPQTLAATSLLEISSLDNELMLDLNYPKKIQPGEKVSINIELTGHQGKPKAGEVTLWLVDQSVLALGKEQPINLLPDFIHDRPRYTTLRDTRNSILGYFPYQERPGGGIGIQSISANNLLDKVTIRKNFSPVPYYNPMIVIGSSGKKTVSFAAPDNLTNFKVRAKAVSGADKFGFHKGQLSIRLPVIVQPSLPRFVRPGDQFTGIAIARVIEGDAGEGLSRIKVDGLTLDGLEESPFKWSIGKPQRLEFELSVPTPSYTKNGNPLRSQVEVTLAVERIRDKARDAFKLSIPIKADRRPISHRQILSLGADHDIHLDAIDTPIRAGTFSRSLLFSSQPELIQMSAGLNYLLEYPHGCTEQRVSRARAQLASEKFDALLYKSPDTSVRKKVIHDTLQWIDQVTTQQGLVSYWPGSSTNITLTSWVLMFLVEAQDAGFTIDPDKFQQLVSALKRSLRSDYTNFISGESYAERSWALAALSKAGEDTRSYIAELSRKLDFLSLESLAQVIVAINQSDEQALSLLQQLYAKLWSGVVFRLHQNNEIYGGLQASETSRNALILPSETRTLAEVLRAASVTPESIKNTYSSDRQQVLIDAMVNLGQGNGWGTTNANAAALLALSEVITSPSENLTNVNVDIKFINTSERIQMGKNPLEHIATQNYGPVNISIDKTTYEGNRSLILMSDTRYLPLAQGSDVAALANGFVVSRELLLIQDDDKPSKKIPLLIPGTEVQFTIGDIIEEHVEVINPGDANYIAIVIPLAAGMEPLNPALATAPPEATPTGLTSLAPSYVASTDDQVAFYYDSLPKGSYHFYFRTRATIPGRFIQPAAFAEKMYDELVNGNSNGARIVISKKQQQTNAQ